MRAWVKKRVDGLYWDELIEEWGKLCYATLHRTRKEATMTLNTDASQKVVKVNIEEVK